MKAFPRLRQVQITIFFFLLCTYLVKGQSNLLYIGDKSYKATEEFCLNTEKQSNVKIVIAKKDKGGIFMITRQLGYPDYKIQGNASVFLENGTKINLVDRGLYDYVDNKSRTSFYLTEAELLAMTKSNISMISWTQNCTLCMGGYAIGRFTAENNGKESYYCPVVDVSLLVTNLMK
jgi:hypothetical protein